MWCNTVYLSANWPIMEGSLWPFADVTHSIHDSTISLVHDSPLFMKMVWKYMLLVLEYWQSLLKNIISNASFRKLTKFHLGTICSQRIKYRGITGRNTLGRNKYFDPQVFLHNTLLKLIRSRFPWKVNSHKRHFAYVKLSRLCYLSQDSNVLECLPLNWFFKKYHLHNIFRNISLCTTISTTTDMNSSHLTFSSFYLQCLSTKMFQDFGLQI